MCPFIFFLGALDDFDKTAAPPAPEPAAASSSASSGAEKVSVCKTSVAHRSRSFLCTSCLGQTWKTFFKMYLY